MSIGQLRRLCLSFPGTTETVQWGDNLVFKVSGKVFAVASLEPGPHFLSLKTTPDQFAELVEKQGITQAPYFARTHWVALESPGTLPAQELEDLVKRSYELVVAGMPRKMRPPTTGEVT